MPLSPFFVNIYVLMEIPYGGTGCGEHGIFSGAKKI